MSEMLKICLIASVLICIACGRTQAQPDIPATLVYRTVIEFDSTQIDNYKEDPDYQYLRKAPKSSRLERIWNGIVAYLRNIFSSGANLSGKVLALLLLAGAILALTYFFLRAQFSSLFIKKDRRSGSIMRVLDEEIPVETLSNRISSAIADGNFRMAWRWIYIDLLRHLDANRMIRIVGSKTNSDYLLETNIYPWQKDFTELANAFDRIWYGEYPMDEASFERYRMQAQRLTHQTSSV